MNLLSLRYLPVLAAVILFGCTPAPTPTTIDVIGDSITVQAVYNQPWLTSGVGAPIGSDVLPQAGLGWRFEDVQDFEAARVSSPSHPRPAILVMALGTNNINVGGWETADENAFMRLLYTPDPSSCVVVSLPAVGPAVGRNALNQYTWARARMMAIAQTRPRTVVTNGWASIIRSHPEYLGPDGVHLRTDNIKGDAVANYEPANAFVGNLWAAVRRCPAA